MKFAFVFVLVGYGTKAGLAPIHSWLPDAHSQAPAPVSAMFSGFLLNTALYCIMRFVPPAHACARRSFASGLLIGFGMLSILVAAGFIVFQRDAKRLLAYHSVEHMGIITLGYGLGPLGAFAALFHTLNHSRLQIAGVFRGRPASGLTTSSSRATTRCRRCSTGRWRRSATPSPTSALLEAYQRLRCLMDSVAVSDVSRAPGFLTGPSCVERYAAASGRDLGHLSFHLGLAYFKLAVILEGIHYRYTQGQTVGGGFASIGEATVPLVTAGLAAAPEES